VPLLILETRRVFLAISTNPLNYYYA